jgi:hypothetical protein
MKPLNEVRATKADNEGNLLNRPGVTGVAVGYKYVGGNKTDEQTIIIYVEEKKDVPENERIPKTIKGVKTDVIERKFVPHPRGIPLADFQPRADTGNYDPLRGGISIGPCRVVGNCIFVGTLGAIVTDNVSGNPMSLSNFHVMCVDNNWSAGDTMAQPSRVDGGNCPTDVVGQLQRASLGGQVDCAVASITNRGHLCEIVDIGEVAGTAEATLGMAVRKRGRTTGLTYGSVDAIDLSVRVDYDDPGCNITGVGTVIFTNQIGIQVDSTQSTQFGAGGDSGSVVVNNSREVVGLYFAGDPAGTFGVANPIQAVLNTLNVSICVPKAKEKPEIKEGFKEKDIIKDFKEFWKEFKEFKEFKEKEFKEFKEKDKDIFENFPFSQMQPGQFGSQAQVQPRMSGGSIEDRLARLEATVGQLSHFIRPELRPDLSAGALKREPDVSGKSLGMINQQLQKQSNDAKQAKDSKDTEKPREA